MPNPKNPGDRVKAHKLRAAVKNGQKLQPVDQLWLSEYEDNQKRDNPAQQTKSYGRSRSARKIDLKIEEAAEAEGTGSAAREAATAALVAKEEGRRIDSLTLNSMEVLKASAAVNKETALMLREGFGLIFETMNRRSEILEQTHIEMLQSVRAHFLAATQMEGALMQKDQEGDQAKELLTLLLAKHLGIPVEGLRAAAALPQPKPRPRPNGVPPRPNGATK